ncbi:hypothetical protein SS05631_c25030 [Sinorhizobium sp. CCBAU 05631]|nr:hypothetical protein SS05631_c25030 [Sinorhizobium sp. CCBAU 05631]
MRILQELRGPVRQERERYGPAPKPGFDAQLRSQPSRVKLDKNWTLGDSGT